MSGVTHTFEGELVELDGDAARLAIDVGDVAMVLVPMSIEGMRTIGASLYERVRVVITVERAADEKCDAMRDAVAHLARRLTDIAGDDWRAADGSDDWIVVPPIGECHGDGNCPDCSVPPSECDAGAAPANEGGVS